jgi:hypothetical protein
VGLELGLEHLKIETRLIDERFPSVMGLGGVTPRGRTESRRKTKILFSFREQ